MTQDWDFDRDLAKWTNRQLEAVYATEAHSYVLYGGAGGGGKSYFLRWWCLRQLLTRWGATGIPGLRVGLFSSDYPTLTDRQISRINREFPDWLGRLRETRTDGYNFQLLPEYGGGTIALRNLDDPSKYKSAEFCDIAVEELTENSKDDFDDLRFRLRWPGIERPCFVGATNPTGKGHAWVKALWVDRKLPAELQPLASEFKYVEARVSDNPHITNKYVDTLKSLPEAKRKALLEGDWSVPEGQYFTNFERSERAIHPAILGQIIQEWWPKWISMDWGFTHHSAVYWHTAGDVMPEQAKLLGRNWDTPRKCVFTYRELIVNMRQAGSDEAHDETELGQQIVAMSGRDKIRRFFLDSNARARKQSGNTPADMIGTAVRAGGLPYPEDADKDREGGWRFMYHLIQDDSWFISSMCPEALNAIPALEYDKDKGGEDIRKVDDISDDCADSLRYGLKSYLQPRNKPQSIIEAEQLAAIPDYTQRNIMAMKFAEQRKGKQRWGRG